MYKILYLQNNVTPIKKIIQTRYKLAKKADSSFLSPNKCSVKSHFVCTLNALNFSRSDALPMRTTHVTLQLCVYMSSVFQFVVLSLVKPRFIFSSGVTLQHSSLSF